MPKGKKIVSVMFTYAVAGFYVRDSEGESHWLGGWGNARKHWREEFLLDVMRKCPSYVKLVAPIYT